MVHEIVVGVGTHERREFRDRLETVEVVLVAEERLPLVLALAPPRSPQCEQVAVGESELDRDDVSSHGWKPIDTGAKVVAGTGVADHVRGGGEDRQGDSNPS